MCKGLLLLITTILGFSGVVMVFFSGVSIFNLDLAQAQADKMDSKLGLFLDCQQTVAQNMTNANVTDEDTRILLEAYCQYQHTPYLTIFCLGGTFALFSVVSGLVAGCRDVKGNLYGYTTISGAALALLVVGIFTMNSLSRDTLRGEKWVPSCNSFSATTQTDITKFDLQCIDDNDTASKWVRLVGVYYAGAILSILSLLSFLMMNACASGDSRLSLQQQKESQQFGDYKSFGGQRA
eukprot:CAMPEP_0175100628 /NCGR_PEP_ID=MMETSP0086_2-20121207/7239_1 /TAXON_ID=136419 /ORGANISM="Unknown Unknown, Strain D1" /LENGTH=236 /DNA_ID=CAMNT_0016374853 /DNA_START=59 /DNA_END=769 /DNA_ORIENTATION=+